MIESLKPLVLDRWLDRQRVLEAKSTIATASAMLGQVMLLEIVDEDQLAEEMLETAEFYVQAGIERDEVDVPYRMMGTIEYGRAARFKLLTQIQWLRHRRLAVDQFRQAVEMERPFKEDVFWTDDWHDIDLAEWMAEHIVLEEFEQARQLRSRYVKDSQAGGARGSPSAVLQIVAECLVRRDDQGVCNEAETALDRLYHKLTDWNAPGFRAADTTSVERFLHAYIRGKHFKNEEDPIRVIKRMKFSE